MCIRDRVSTFHSSCVRILRRHIEYLGYRTNFTIYDGDDQRTLMKQIFKRLDVDTKQFKERAVLSRISSAKDDMITPEEFELNAGGDFREKKVAQIYKEYQKELKKNNALDFDDLIVKTVELFQNVPDAVSYTHLNDLTMIKFAGLGVAMENAVLPVRKAADYITMSNNDDGIAHVVEKFMLH